MKIIFIVDSIERLHFFLRLGKALQHRHKIYFATTEPLVLILAKANNIDTFYLNKRKILAESFTTSEISEAAESSIEYLNNIYTEKTATNYITAFSEQLKIIIEKTNADRIIIWNGQQTIGRAATLAARLTKSKKIYLEIANLPNKIFADEYGVNALSSIAHNPEILDALPPVSDHFHARWMKEYESIKKQPLPQARKNIKLKLQNTINILLKALTLQIAPKEILNKIHTLLAIKTSSTSHREAINKPYIFLPLQVSTDTQIKLHSDIDNTAAIEIAARQAKAENAKLVVKLHPAEKCQGEIKRIVKLQRTIGFKLTQEDTITLIKNSKSVITINSTVGLEALLYNKDVISLGRCFYKEFDQIRLKKYIHHYLIDGVSYFESNPISYSQAACLIKASEP